MSKTDEQSADRQYRECLRSWSVDEKGKHTRNNYDNASISLDGIPSPPRTNEGQLNQFYRWFQNDLDDYNATAAERRALEQAAHPSDIDSALILWLPISLSLVLALQFLKVSSDLWWKKKE